MCNFEVYKSKYDPKDYIFEDRFLVADHVLPKEFNLLDKTPEATNQITSSCAAHAACACRSMLEGNKDLILSKSFLYFQTRVLEKSTDRDCGVTIKNIMKSLRKWGVCEEKYMGNEEDFKQVPSKDAFENAKKYKIKDYLRINSLYGIKNWLIGAKQPVLFGLQVTEDLKSDKVAQTGILPRPSKNPKIISSHGAMIIGWKDSTPLEQFLSKFSRKYSSTGSLLIHNSWGSNWGIDGNFWMPYDIITQGLAFDFWIMEK